jgi:Uma2 family endonuclease
MSALPNPERWTVEAYLELELNSEIKHEYFDGEVYAMTGASRNHNLISINTATSLNTQLRENLCEAYQSDMRVRVSRKQYVYPDVTVVCGETQFSGEKPDTLLNATVLIEVLSPSTEGYDKTTKSEYYRSITTLQEYLLIYQEKCHIEHFARQADGNWLVKDVFQMDGKLELTSIQCTLAASDVYNKVKFDHDDVTD